MINMNSASSYRQPSCGAILGGILISVGLLVIFCLLPEVVKILGAPFLFLPAKLGLIRDVGPAQVLRLDLASHQTTLEFLEAGRYDVYTGDADLLQLTDGMYEQNTHPWLKVEEKASGRKLAVDYVKRGLIPFDSALVRGRMIYTFSVREPGIYILRHPARHEAIAILPDAITGKEKLLVVTTLLQLGILLSPLVYIAIRRRKIKQARLQAIRDLHKT